MAGRRGVAVYKGARVVSRASGVTSAENGARDATVTLYEGLASAGYRTDYERRPVRWLVVEVDGEKPYTFRYSGKNFGEAGVQFEQCAAELVGGPVAVVGKG